jgi:hypothetical protein
VYLDFFISSSSPESFTRPENSRSNGLKNRGNVKERKAEHAVPVAVSQIRGLPMEP